MSGKIRQLANLIRKDRGASLAYGMAFNIASELIAAGVLLPPVKIGQTVYAALAYDDGEDVIDEYTVGGVGYIDGEWLAYCKKDRDWYKYGTELCKPTREEAEAAIAAARSAADKNDGHKTEGAK
jgi:hypothetical protein